MITENTVGCVYLPKKRARLPPPYRKYLITIKVPIVSEKSLLHRGEEYSNATSLRAAIASVISPLLPDGYIHWKFKLHRFPITTSMLFIVPRARCSMHSIVSRSGSGVKNHSDCIRRTDDICFYSVEQKFEICSDVAVRI